MSEDSPGTRPLDSADSKPPGARPWVPAAVFCGALALDQATKIWAVSSLSDGKTISIVGPVFQLKLVHNTGIAFGMQLMAWLIVPVSLIAISALWWLRRQAAMEGLLTTQLRTAFALLLSGGLGNLIDRIRQGYVVDFLDLSFWPTFNFADVAICVGVGLMLLCWPKEKPHASRPI